MEGEPKTAQLIADWRGGALDARNTLIARLHPELSTIAAARFTKADAMGRLVAFHQAFLSPASVPPSPSARQAAP